MFERKKNGTRSIRNKISHSCFPTIIIWPNVETKCRKFRVHSSRTRVKNAWRLAMAINFIKAVVTFIIHKAYLKLVAYFKEKTFYWIKVRKMVSVLNGT